MTTRRTVIENGYVLSMDDAIGELETGAILIEDDRIVTVAAELGDVDAERIDADGGVVMPGFVDTHRHTWQASLRGLCADWTLFDYLVGVRLTLSPLCTAHDVYVGNYVGALEALDAGVTTILDFSHCNNTPEHADQAVQGLTDAGVRAIFAYGMFHPPAAEPHFTSHAMRIADARRVHDRLAAHPTGLVTMGISLTEPGLIPVVDMRTEVETARELGVRMAIHTGCVWSLPSGLDQYAAAGMLGPDIVHVHCNACTEREWELLRASDAKISTSPETEMQMGMGRPPIRETLDRGLTLSLSCDVASGNSGDMFSQMRLGLQFARCQDNDAYNARRSDPAELALTARDALTWATVNGATALGLEDRVGSLTPGKQADVIIVGPGNGRLNMIAPANRVGAVVTQANASNVQTVLVAGQVVKRDGRLIGVDVDRVRGLVETSYAQLMARLPDGQPLLPAERGSFDALAPALMSNLDVAEALAS